MIKINSSFENSYFSDLKYDILAENICSSMILNESFDLRIGTQFLYWLARILTFGLWNPEASAYKEQLEKVTSVPEWIKPVVERIREFFNSFGVNNEMAIGATVGAAAAAGCLGIAMLFKKFRNKEKVTRQEALNLLKLNKVKLEDIPEADRNKPV